MEKLDELLWRAPEWIRNFGQLCKENVLEYFSLSPFFDRKSNNSILRMQGNGIMDPMIMQIPELREKKYLETINLLEKMKGIEFTVDLVASRDPDLWVIHKVERLSPTETKPLSTYFIMDESIFMAPSVYNVVASHVLNSVYSLKEALSEASNSLACYDPDKGFYYNFDYNVEMQQQANANNANSTNNNTINATNATDASNENASTNTNANSNASVDTDSTGSTNNSANANDTENSKSTSNENSTNTDENANVADPAFISLSLRNSLYSSIHASEAYL